MLRDSGSAGIEVVIDRKIDRLCCVTMLILKRMSRYIILIMLFIISLGY